MRNEKNEILNDRGENPIRVLIVDDEEIVRVNLEAFFEDEGFWVRTASNAEDALHIFSAQIVDAGIIDVRLPRMDGNAMVLAAHQMQPHAVFILHTGSIDYAIPDSLREIGVSPEHVFIKPIADMRGLAHRVECLVKARREGQSMETYV